MNIDFKVLWIDDAHEWVESLKPELEHVIHKYHLYPRMEHETGENDVHGKITSNEYDLILVDYQLANDGRGDIIIEQIRKNNVLTDIVFYSSDMHKMRKELSSGKLLEGIYFSERDDYKFIDRVEALIQKAIKRANDVVNLRGIVMDNTSEFDQDIKEILLVAFNKISEKHKSEITAYVKKDVLQSSLDGLNNDFMKCIDSENCMITSLNSKDYILSSDQKARILNRILKKLKNEYKFSSDNKAIISLIDNFYATYKSEIIDYRNCLAHAKKGNGKGKDIYIGSLSGSDVIFCDELCTDMRAKLIKYKSFLNLVFDFVENM